MYLITVYFDEQSNKTIQRYMNKVAEYTGNHFMIDNTVPPHLTVLSFQANDQQDVINRLKKSINSLFTGSIYYVSLGVFLPYVLYITPVLNNYLMDISFYLHKELKNIENINFNHFYLPNSWLPHTTIGKKLDEKQMIKAFEVLQKEFQPFQAKVIRLALSKTNPYEDIISFDLKDKIYED